MAAAAAAAAHALPNMVIRGGRGATPMTNKPSTCPLSGTQLRILMHLFVSLCKCSWNLMLEEFDCLMVCNRSETVRLIDENQNMVSNDSFLIYILNQTFICFVCLAIGEACGAGDLYAVLFCLFTNLKFP